MFVLPVLSVLFTHINDLNKIDLFICECGSGSDLNKNRQFNMGKNNI